MITPAQIQSYILVGGGKIEQLNFDLISSHPLIC